ncbi:MAG: serine acetyltransferase [Planctomycetota bacterium]|nr:MAG: serine acetyltransferase [Planctomycetota bacterium]
MIGEFDLDDRLQDLVDRIVANYESDPRTRHIDRGYLPSYTELVRIIEMLLEVSFPGYFGRQNLSSKNVRYHVGDLLPRLAQALYMQTFRSLCHLNEIEGNYDPNGPPDQATPFDRRAREMAIEFLNKIPDVRDMLAFDVQAAYDGDPASANTDEVVLAYPGLLAITIQRYAHELYKMQVPLMPRTMSEWAHKETGIDIHPGARIGRSFFIDHGTGVVIGETTDIGDNVKIYQGVTLGALSFLKDERGRMVRGYKRHPTVRNSVTIYANAIILGGDTVIGEGATIGGSTFLTSSVPAGCTVTNSPPELTVRPPKARKPGQPVADFDI